MRKFIIMWCAVGAWVVSMFMSLLCLNWSQQQYNAPEEVFNRKAVSHALVASGPLGAFILWLRMLDYRITK